MGEGRFVQIRVTTPRRLRQQGSLAAPRRRAPGRQLAGNPDPRPARGPGPAPARGHGHQDDAATDQPSGHHGSGKPTTADKHGGSRVEMALARCTHQPAPSRQAPHGYAGTREPHARKLTGKNQERYAPIPERRATLTATATRRRARGRGAQNQGTAATTTFTRSPKAAGRPASSRAAAEHRACHNRACWWPSDGSSPATARRFSELGRRSGETTCPVES
jgi:hypothetical protein